MTGVCLSSNVMTAHFKYLSSPQSLSLELEDILFSFSIKLLHLNAGKMTHHFLGHSLGNWQNLGTTEQAHMYNYTSLV
jgi:hypothetical protein